MAQTSLNSTGVASSAALSLQSNGTTEAIGISTGQVATLAQNPILTSGTANGLAFLNASKVLTTGSALTFDGTNLGVGGTPNNYAGYKTLAVIGPDTTHSGIVRVRTSDDVIGMNIYADSTGPLFNTTNNPLRFLISDSEKMRLDQAGNLGLGVTPSAYSGSTRAIDFQYNGTITTGDDGFRQAIAFGSNFYETGSGSYKYKTTSGTIPASMYRQRDAVHAWFNAPSGTAGNAITFTQAMTLNASGQLLLGSTSGIGSNISVLVKGTSAGEQQFTAWSATTSGDPYFMEFGTEATYTARGSIRYSRGTGLTLYNTTSDYRAKDISGPVIGSGALIDSTPVYMGKMKGATQERPMFIAHETPDYAHTGEKDAVDADGNPVYQQMDASALIPVMWAEIQDLRKRLAALESK